MLANFPCVHCNFYQLPASFNCGSYDCGILAWSFVILTNEGRLAFLCVPEQAYVGQFLATFREYTPRQKAASFTIDGSAAGAPAAPPMHTEPEQEE